MLDRKIKHIHLYGIDNVLTKSADPAFIGYCIKNNCEVANKVVARANAGEKVGVSATRSGKLCIVEYSELPASMTGTDVNGVLIYSAANICNHYFNVKFLLEKVFSSNNGLYHLAHKKIPYYDPRTKKTVKPEANNGVKLEMFVFDVFPLADRWKIMEVVREDEFAPVKNAPGSDTDSPDTARALMYSQGIRWLTAAGAQISNAEAAVECEISPLVSYAGEGLEKFQRTRLKLPLYISDGVARESMVCGEERLVEILSSYSIPAKTMKYGTAGFRDEWNTLHAIFIRMGVLAALRSRSSHGKCTGVMITASHNPEKDNGIKIVDTDGGMLSQDWEPLAEEIANIANAVDVLGYVGALEDRLGCSDNTMNATIIVGRDTRPHSKELFDCVCAGAFAMGATVLDLGEVTTPQLHFVVQATNAGDKTAFDDFNRDAALTHYHTTLMVGYTDLCRSSPNNRPRHVVVDGAFGVGAISITEFIKTLTAYCKSKPDMAEYTLEVDLRNAARAGKVNEECGAEIVQKGQRPPCNFDASRDGGKLMCSYDGDADRIVFQSFLPDPSTGENSWVLFDGDKIASLVSAFLIEEMRAAGLTEGSNPCVMGVVQTAYANGASTAFLRSRGIDITFTKTGVKYLHHAAHSFDVGVYFEANGHGTVLFSQKFAQMVATADAGVAARKAIAIRRLKVCSSARDIDK
jgi:phosphoacetylglucosamine mutase